MSTATHVVLGGSGVVGRETAKALRRRGETIISVGRRPSSIDGVRHETADLTQAGDASRVLAGAQVAYFTVGLPYATPVWEKQWPILLRNTIDAAIEHGTHLIYLDNVYAYGTVDAPMTEDTPVRPTSRKGKVRADALLALEAARNARGLQYTIGRSADFYGPAATTSIINRFLIDPIAAGKRATWLINSGVAHSLTYTPDIGEALATLGTTPAVQGQTWHLPTAPALTGEDYAELAAGAGAQMKIMSLAALRIGGLFDRSARATIEMAYQFAAPYVFDSSRFESAFNISPTSSRVGISEALQAVRRS